MKKICFFAWFFWIMTALLSAQTLLIDPSSGGGFESGPSFQQSGWTVSQAGQKNSYRLGDKPGLDDGQGTRCAFISKNNSNWQSSTDASISHLYRTVSFPENASEILLDFLYKLKFTDIGYDGFKVYLSSSTPRAGRLPSGTQIGAECYDSATVWTNASISLRYALDEACTVKIKIYNQRGQLVRRLEQQHNAPGYFNIFFDGRSEDGEALSSGIYFYTFEAGRTRSIHKMTLLK